MGRPFLLVIVVILVLLSCACSPGTRPAAPSARPLTVGWFLWTGWYPLVLAKEMKLFEKHGVDVKLVLYDSYPQILPDLAGGKLDGAFNGLYEILRAGIPDSHVVMVSDYSEGSEGVVVRDSIRSARDLAGAKIGVQGPLTGSEFVVQSYMRNNSIDPQTITFLDVPPEQVLSRMPDTIDGGYTWDPYLSQASAKGFRVLFTTADMPGLIPDVAVFHGRVLRERREDVERFVAAFFEAANYWKKHPQEAAAIIARATGQKPEDIVLKGCRLLSMEDNIQAFQKRDDFRSIHYTIRKQVEFLESMGDNISISMATEMMDASCLKR